MDSSTGISSKTQTQSSPPPQSASDLSGRTLGEFHLLRRLGQGGMGQVYLAEQGSLKRKVAVKVMRADVAEQLTSFQRFRAEAEAIARINHNNIVQVFAFGEDNGLHFMALEYVEGRNLREFLEKKGPPDLPVALSIMCQVANALQRAAELGIIHRDIKPENILLTRRGEVKVADFGLARCLSDDRAVQLTQSGITMGTPLYMSPEQVQGRPLDPRSDIYSFGVSCYQMFTGRPPYRGQSPFDVALQHLEAQAQPVCELRPDLPEHVGYIVHKMMARDRDERYQSCAELLNDLAALEEQVTAHTADGSPSKFAPLPSQANGGKLAARQRRRRRSRVALVAGSFLLAALAGAAWAWARYNPEKQQPTQLADEVGQAVLSEEQKEEKFLKEAVARYANPGTKSAALQTGLSHCLELGLFYLERNRFADAQAFFESLVNNSAKVEPYKLLGQLGLAITLARLDRPAESNDMFLKLLGSRPAANKIERSFLAQLLVRPQLRFHIARALDHNKANASKDQAFPERLEELRRPPAPSPPVGPMRNLFNKKGGNRQDKSS